MTAGAQSRATPPDLEAAYYQTIEEFFVSRRGDPLFLSNADWNLVRKWRQAGIPLRVVLRGITDALDGHAHSFSRDRKVGSLSYCAREVEEARERWARALALGGVESGLDLPAILEGFARDLERAGSLGPRAARAAAEAAKDLRRRAGAGRLEDVESGLLATEASVVEAIREDEGGESVERLAAEIEAALAPYRQRMPARVLERLRQDSMVRRLLEKHGLPRLSLFHLEAREAASARP